VKIFFEQYQYPQSSVEGILDNDLYMNCANNKVQIPYVGYYYAPSIKDKDDNVIGDSVFILPKVFLTLKNVDGVKQHLAFGKYLPENLIDESNQNKLSEFENEFVFGLSTWLYRAIGHFVERHPDTKIVKISNIQNVVSTKGDDSQTFLDIVLSLIRFHKEHKNLFTYITILNRSGKSAINWDKTINRTTAIIKNGKPFYPETIAKSKVINIEEDLIVIFYSVLNYLSSRYNCRIDRSIEYKLIKPAQIQHMIDSGKGTRVLKQIRRKYFTDEFVALWNLLRVFFDKAHRVATRKYSQEKLLVSSFNIVFEDMIDQLIGDSKEKLLDGSLKDQDDDKRVDHIYKDTALMPDSDIYFIGDSKYYIDGNDVKGAALFKQYTYAKNVIQVCMNIFNDDKSKLGTIRYVDELTEGYNITPNFFIRGNISNFEKMNYSHIELENETSSNILDNRSVHWKDRLFDRDTLILQTYNINFLFVLASYVTHSNDNSLKKKVHKKFREDIINTLNSHYVFWKAYPKDMKAFVTKHFRLLLGKMYRANPSDNYIWIAFELENTRFQDLLDQIQPDCVELLEAQGLDL